MDLCAIHWKGQRKSKGKGRKSNTVVVGANFKKPDYCCRLCVAEWQEELVGDFEDQLKALASGPTKRLLCIPSKFDACKAGHDKKTKHLCSYEDLPIVLRKREQNKAKVANGDAKPKSGLKGDAAKTATEIQQQADFDARFKTLQDQANKQQENFKKKWVEAGRSPDEIEDDFLDCEIFADPIEVEPEPNTNSIDEAAVKKKLGQLQVSLKNFEKMDDEGEMCESIRKRITEAKALLVQATPPEKREKDLERNLNYQKKPS